MHDKTFTIISTKWGYMGSVWTPLGLWELGWFGNDRAAALAGIDAANAVESEGDERAAELKRELDIYLQGFPVDFSVPVDWRGYTSFQRQVLQYTAHIPYGAVETYGQVAAAVGSPKAARAVGQSLHINRTPIVVPCHRVLGANGSLTGFGGGLSLKKALLMLERPEMPL